MRLLCMAFRGETLSFYSIINTAVQKMLGVSDIHAVLQEADSQGLSVFDSHSRPRVILNKTGANVEHRVWVVEGLFYMAKNELFDKDVSKADLKGDHRTSNKGLRDLLVFKHSLKRHLFQPETPFVPTTSCSTRMCRSPSGSSRTSSRA